MSKIKIVVLATDLRITQAALSLDLDVYDIATFSTPEQALLSIDSSISVVLIELKLNGFSVARSIAERGSDTAPKIIMFPDRAHDEWLCKQAGADLIVVKPLSDTANLVRAIDSVLVHS